MDGVRRGWQGCFLNVVLSGTPREYPSSPQIISSLQVPERLQQGTRLVHPQLEPRGKGHFPEVTG